MPRAGGRDEELPAALSTVDSVLATIRRSAPVEALKQQTGALVAAHQC
jgi:hypothetical protein